MKLAQIARTMSRQLGSLQFAPPVTHVYNPLEYAWDAFEIYLKRYGGKNPLAILLGMNPGPWGMAQTGIPFGEVNFVRDWLEIETEILPPKRQHPKRPVLGFSCPRSEVSGQRVWSWAKDTFERPEAFFDMFFVVNYCPLMFMEESGKNRTPDRLPVGERRPVVEICDLALRQTVEALQPKYVIGIGKFAETRANTALENIDVQIGRILHPSPANPQANKGWAPIVSSQLEELGIQLPP